MASIGGGRPELGVAYANAEAGRLDPRALKRLHALDPSQTAESHEKHVEGHP